MDQVTQANAAAAEQSSAASEGLAAQVADLQRAASRLDALIHGTNGDAAAVRAPAPAPVPRPALAPSRPLPPAQRSNGATHAAAPRSVRMLDEDDFV